LSHQQNVGPNHHFMTPAESLENVAIHVAGNYTNILKWRSWRNWQI